MVQLLNLNPWLAIKEKLNIHVLLPLLKPDGLNSDVINILMTP